jgi:formylglycine-generating enzyme required for sulfatase activity
MKRTTDFILLLSLLALMVIINPQVTDSASSEGEVFTNSIGMKFALIPAGSFVMGSPEADEKASRRSFLSDFLAPVGKKKDLSQHKVTISKQFFMQTTELTQEQWKKVMGNNPSMYTRCGDDCPVESVSWEDAQEFIERLNQLEGTDKYRLPTEAEWEYGCRAGTTTKYNWGDEDPVCEPGAKNGARYDDNTKCDDKGAAPVMTYAPNRWGLYDMHGNVHERCQDWYGDYPGGQVTDPKGPSSGKFRVSRGGSHGSDSWEIRAADRFYSPADRRSRFVGLRLMRDM